MNNSATDTGMHARARHRRNTIRFALLAGLILPQLAWSAAGSTWKWQDADGNVTYGDSPPRGVAAEQVSVRIGSSSSASSGPAIGEPDEREQAGSARTTKVAAGISPEDAATLCQQAKTNLAVLDSNALIRQTDETGEERILDEQEKQDQMHTAREIIRYHCR